MNNQLNADQSAKKQERVSYPDWLLARTQK